MSNTGHIIIKPLVTEKMTQLSEKLNRYGFAVRRDVNKLQIKKAVEDMYNVTVKSVNTMRYAGKLKTRYTKAGVISGRKQGYKKAIVTLVEGNKIDFYSNI
ncbi:MAG: 50S ribosomal protein L23 [Cytophagaceae bacterium]|jgi:large subunit ribosomal protein L23|nr:50S ribosomal protein L23 [Cytophagaceae bacterium]